MILQIFRNNCAAVYFDEAGRAIQVASWKPRFPQRGGASTAKALSGSLYPSLLSSMPLQRSAVSAWIVIMAPNRIRERPNDGTWEPGRVELNGCQTLKAPQHVNKHTKAGWVHF